MACIFCEIVTGSAPAHVVWEDETTMAFLDINPSADGHILVIPKTHAEDIWDIDVDSMADVARTVHRMTSLLQDRLDPDGLTLIQTNRSAGWQDVFHLHVHLVPRSTGDDLVRPWHPTPHRRDRLHAIHALLQ